MPGGVEDRKSTRLNSSHVEISYAVFCLKKKNPATSFSHSRACAPLHQHRRARCGCRGTFSAQGTESPSQSKSSRGAKLSFFFNDTATTEIYTLSLHDALPI